MANSSGFLSNIRERVGRSHPGRTAGMPFKITRRNFLAGLGAAAAASAASSVPAWALFDPPLYPPIDLSYFDTPITPAPADIRLGHASITWHGNDRQPIEDISPLGFRAIQ